MAYIKSLLTKPFIVLALGATLFLGICIAGTITGNTGNHIWFSTLARIVFLLMVAYLLYYKRRISR